MSKLNIELNGKNKKILMIIVPLLIIFIFYFAIYKPIVSRGETLKGRIEEMQRKMDTKDFNYKDKAKIEQEIQKLKDENAEILNNYPAVLTQEHSFRFLLDVEKYVQNIRVRDISFSKVTPFGENSEEKSGDEAGQENKAKSSEENEKPKKDGEEIFISSIDFTVKTDYKGLKKLLKYIDDYENKIVVEQISVNKSEKSRKFDANMKVKLISVKYSENQTIPEFDKVPFGKDIFFENVDMELDDETLKELNAKKESLHSKLSGPHDSLGDAFIDINSPNNTASAQSIGLAKSISETIVRSDENAQIVMDLTVEKDGDSYVMKYFVNGVTKSGSIERGEAIEIDIYSSARDGADDLSGVTLNLRNKTDEVVYLNLYNEDMNNPRFKVGETKGEYLVR